MNIIYESMTEENYRRYILYIVNRIIQENLFIIEGFSHDTRVVFGIQIKSCEWYDEVDESVKIDVMSNLKRHIFRNFQASTVILNKTVAFQGRRIITDRHLHARSRQPVKI